MEDKKPILVQIRKNDNNVINVGLLQEDGTYSDDAGPVVESFETDKYSYLYIGWYDLKQLIENTL